MAERSLGIVVPGGSPKRLTCNEVDPTIPVRATSYRLQHLPSNVAQAYIGNADMDYNMGIGIFWSLPSPLSAEPWPGSSPDISRLSTPHDLSQIYVDSPSPTDGFIVTAMI